MCETPKFYEMLIQGTDELLSLPSTTETGVKMQSPRGLTVRTVGAHVPACGSDPRPLLKVVFLGGGPDLSVL